MQDNLTGYIVVGLFILLFVVGTGSLLIDSLLNRPMDISLQNLQPENSADKAFANYTVKFLEDD